MTIQFIARVACDTPDCTSTADLPIDVGVGCGGDALATVETLGSGWLDDDANGAMRCPACCRGEGPVLPPCTCREVRLMSAPNKVAGMALDWECPRHAKAPVPAQPSPLLFPVVTCRHCGETQARVRFNTCCGKRLP